MVRRVSWLGLVALSLAAGYGVYDSMQSFYPLRGGREAIPGYPVSARAASGVATAALLGAVAFGLARLVRSQPRADRGLVVAAWAGWVLFGTALALGYSAAEAIRGFEESHYRTFVSWIVVRALMAGLGWAGVVLVGLAVWRRAQLGAPNQSLHLTRPV